MHMFLNNFFQVKKNVFFFSNMLKLSRQLRQNSSLALLSFESGLQRYEESMCNPLIYSIMDDGSTRRSLDFQP